MSLTCASRGFCISAYVCFIKTHDPLIVYSQSFNIKYIKGPYEEVEVYFLLIVKIHIIKKKPSISATVWKNYILFDTTTSIAFKIMFFILQKLQYIRQKYLCKYKPLMYIYCDANMTGVKGRVERSILHGKETKQVMLELSFERWSYEKGRLGILCRRKKHTMQSELRYGKE